MKTFFLLLFLLISAVYYSQIGVNTENPQSSFHVDGAKDNNITGVPTTPQQGNDFVLTSTGNVGIGKINPTNKLDVTSTTAGAIKITDGTQGEGKILTSDANGVGIWKNPATQNVDVLLRVTAPEGQMIGTTLTTVNFTASIFDRNSNFDLVTDRFIAPTAGYYLVICTLHSDTSVTEQGRYAYIGKNGGIYELIGASKVSPLNSYAISGSTIVSLNPGDYVSVLAGSTIGSYPIYSVSMSVIKISN